MHRRPRRGRRRRHRRLRPLRLDVGGHRHLPSLGGHRARRSASRAGSSGSTSRASRWSSRRSTGRRWSPPCARLIRTRSRRSTCCRGTAAPGPRGTGRVGELPVDESLREFTAVRRRSAARHGGGCGRRAVPTDRCARSRCAAVPARPWSTGPGSGADAYLTADLKHHTAVEAVTERTAPTARTMPRRRQRTMRADGAGRRRALGDRARRGSTWSPPGFARPVRHYGGGPGRPVRSPIPWTLHAPSPSPIPNRDSDSSGERRPRHPAAPARPAGRRHRPRPARPPAPHPAGARGDRRDATSPAALHDDVVDAETQLSDIAAEQRRLENDVDTVRPRERRDEQRLQAGGLPCQGARGPAARDRHRWPAASPPSRTSCSR